MDYGHAHKYPRALICICQKEKRKKKGVESVFWKLMKHLSIASRIKKYIIFSLVFFLFLFILTLF